MWQRAKELGALPTGLVKAGEVFEWGTIEPWAEEISEDEALKMQAAQSGMEVPAGSASGGRVVAGRSEHVDMSSGPRRRPKQGAAETP